MSKQKLMLTLEDATNICMRYLQEADFFDKMPDDAVNDYKKLVEQDMEQKCWIRLESSDPMKELMDYISAIHPQNIADRIRTDSLRRWCEQMQVDMQMVLINMNHK